jgi:hypothetical protein
MHGPQTHAQPLGPTDTYTRYVHTRPGPLSTMHAAMPCPEGPPQQGDGEDGNPFSDLVRVGGALVLEEVVQLVLVAVVGAEGVIMCQAP